LGPYDFGDNWGVPQSLSKVLVHLVFSTKHRTRSLTSELRAELYPYLGSILRDQGCVPVQIGGVEDHIHLLLGMSRTMTLAHIVEKVKIPATKWLKSKGLLDFSWQNGYGVFSVGHREMDQVVNYIRSQEEHHKHVSFQEEFRALLTEAGVQFDEKYVWD
jgi:putative transposase